jgi:hypothetical protein
MIKNITIGIIGPNKAIANAVKVAIQLNKIKII